MKIPGMLYIFLSFTPWIVYWILCGLGITFGIVISLIISLCLITPQVYRRSFNLMDVASITYFSIAFIGTYAFSMKIFVEKSGFIGYLALTLMALISLITKRPFTLQVSKRDHPKIYWNSKWFLLVNNLITSIWCMIFLTNMFIFLLFTKPHTSIFSNTLIAIGIVLSIILPLKIPAYLAIREFKKYDWSVRIDPKKPKKDNEYDAIIVGSGIGGLTCGALLSKRGYKVLVLEQHYQVGGYCSSFKRNSFIFNTGVENISGLWGKGPINYLLRELNLSKDDLFVKNSIRIIFKGKVIDFNSLEEFIEALIDIFPKEKENIIAFFDEARRAYEEGYREVEVYGTPLPVELIVKVFGERKLLDYPKEHPHFYDWLNKTYKGKLDEYFTNEDLKTLLCALIGYIGACPDEIYASSALTAVISYYIYGGYYPKGGAQNFANKLREVIESYGGRVLVRHKVTKILVEDGEVKGVKVGNNIYKSSIVVANANAKTVFLELIDRKNLNEKFINYIRSLKMSPSCFMVFLGVDMDLSKYPTLIVNLDEGYHIVINSNADPSLAPRGKASITIITDANYYDFPERGTKEYIEEKKRRTKEMIEKAEKIIPNLSKRIVVVDAATPKTFERYTSMPEGAIYAFDQSIKTKRPYFKTPIKGLYLASASTFPGGGIEAVVISGTICANDICGWRIKKH